MEFGLSEDQKLLQESIGRTLEKVSPLERVRKAADEHADYAGDVWQALAELGVAGMLIAEEHGGMGMGLLDAALASEMLAGMSPPAALRRHRRHGADRDWRRGLEGAAGGLAAEACKRQGDCRRRRFGAGGGRARGCGHCRVRGQAHRHGVVRCRCGGRRYIRRRRQDGRTASRGGRCEGTDANCAHQHRSHATARGIALRQC